MEGDGSRLEAGFGGLMVEGLDELQICLETG